MENKEKIQKEILEVAAAFDKLITNSVSYKLSPAAILELIEWRDDTIRRLSDKFRFAQDIEILRRTDPQL